MSREKYFIQLWDLIELEVTKEQFIQTEEFCGFYAKIDGETATNDFGVDKQGFKIRGRKKN